jgi:hypothetical protein
MRAAILVLLVGCSIPDKFLIDAGGSGSGDASAIDSATMDGPAPDGMPTTPRHVFVTSALFRPTDLNSVTGADARCASLSPIPGAQFRAWISDPASPVELRFTHPTVPYVDMNGQVIAASWSQLIAGALQTPIVLDENKMDVTTNPNPNPFQCQDPQCLDVWTATDQRGKFFAPNCTEWQQTGGSGIVGRVGDPGSAWTLSNNIPCQFIAHLYCFEQ